MLKVTFRVDFLNRTVAFLSRQIALCISAYLLKLGPNIVLNPTFMIRPIQPLVFCRLPHKLMSLAKAF